MKIRSLYKRKVKKKDGEFFMTWYKKIKIQIQMVRSIIFILFNHNAWLYSGPSWSYASWIKNYLCNLLITPKVESLNLTHGEVYSIQHYVMKFVSDLQQVNCFLQVLLVSSSNKTDCHDITEILLKVALNIII